MSDFERGDRVYLRGIHQSVRVDCKDAGCEKNHIRDRNLATGEWMEETRRHYDGIESDKLGTVLGYEGSRVVIGLDDSGYNPDTLDGTFTTDEELLRRV